MYYKVKVKISCPDADLSSVLFLNVPIEDMYYLFSFSSLYFAMFKKWCTPRTASRYHRLFVGDSDAKYCSCVVLSCSLMPRA